MSNSKLNAAQKAWRKGAMLALADNGGTIATSEGGFVTVAIMPEFAGSRMARMATSWASPDEMKLRRKVGEYHALERMYNGESALVPAFWDAQVLADEFDHSLLD